MAQDNWGRDAFERIEPLLAQVDDDTLAPMSTSVTGAAMAAIAVSKLVMEPAMYATFQRLAALEDFDFDMRHVDGLADLAWGTLYVAKETARLRHALTRSRLPDDLVQEATAIKARMQSCCEYHLIDHPEAGTEVERLRAGRGHRDLALDLLGYADLYQRYQPVVATDSKHYRASDAADALRLSKELFGLLGDALIERERSVSAQLNRAWTLLVDSYNEVRTVGHFLFRRDPVTADQMFPSLFAVGRAPQTRRGNDEPIDDLPPLPPEDPAAQPDAPSAAQA